MALLTLGAIALAPSGGSANDSLPVSVADSTPPPPPRLTDTDPDSPANDNSPRVKGRTVAEPWFLYVAPTAPHAPFAPEPKYRNSSVPEFAPNPAYLESDWSDKPPFIERPSPAPVLAHRTAQLRMLRSVDDLVARVFSALEATGELDNTLAFFISDNGYMWGEHGMYAKPWPYTHSAEIPFYLRWPARLAGGVDDQRIVANIDLAPTVMDAAGLGGDPAMDGTSLLEGGSRDRILLESLAGAPAFHVRTWASIRTPAYQYTEWYGDDQLTPDDRPVFREYYDLDADPWQLSNYLWDADAGNDPAPETIRALHRKLATDLNCAGRDGLAGSPACGPTSASPGGGPGEPDRPNVLFIVTDDQRPTETLDVMPRTRELFDRQGTYFPNAFATTPLCCPARASILTGRFAHNHRVIASRFVPLLDHGSTIERHLREAGYRTGIYGKFLNDWDLTQDPPHFDEWSVFNNGPHTNFEANEQGQTKTIAQYSTSYVAAKAAQFIRQQKDPGSTVRLYKAPTTADCTPANLAATGTAADFASAGLTVSVPDNSITRFRATVSDAAGNVSACSSSSISYVEASPVPDGTPPFAPGGGSSVGDAGLRGAPIRDTSGPVMAVADKVAKMDRRGLVRVRVSCPPSEPGGCRGTLSLETLRRMRVGRHGPGQRPLKKKVRLGRRSFQAAGGKTVVVKIRLSSRNRRLIRKLRKLRVRARIDARDRAGNVKTATRILRLVARKQRARRGADEKAGSRARAVRPRDAVGA